MNEFYTDYAEYLGRLFPAEKVQKLSLNTGRGCPNRDGTLGVGGCIYCNNSSFTPGYCFGVEGIRGQLEAGKRFFGRKYHEMKYLAYFQSFSSTYGADSSQLMRDLEEACSVEGVVGIVVGTRPDCVGEDVVSVLKDVARRIPVIVELGIETLNDRTLKVINRSHDSGTSLDAIRRLSAAGLHVGVHLIAGLPGESDQDVLDTVKRICAEPVDCIKMHQLQVLCDTPLERMIAAGEIEVIPYTCERYLDLCEQVVRAVPKSVAIERFVASAPPGMVLMPKWGIKNYMFTDKLLRRLRQQKQVQE